MESLRNMCRVCLRVEDSVPLLNWNLPVEDINEKLSYAECFQLCTQLNLLLNKEFEMNGPSLRIYEHFCYSCAAKLKEAYEFIRKAQEADTTLRMNYWKVDSGDDKKLFEWVGVGKDSLSIDIKERESDEEPLTLESNTHMDENSTPQDFIMKASEESSIKSEILKSSKPTTRKKS
ncbi:uncharacterized protein LOC118732362, partial [Rhagoletis pomonella]|uniref:uncharacterized protein LOC118732362 n=1 Tax=Rhagoletis pomonella TaxID=28610 RepID=UPI0017869032